MILKLTRKEAIEAGDLFYMTGSPCNHGHFSKRYVKDFHCVECKKAHGMLAKKNNPERQKQYEKKYKEQNKEKCLKTQNEYRQRNREKARAEYKKWYENNKNKALKRQGDWRKNNPEAAKAISLNRISRQKNAEGHFTKNDVLNKKIEQENKCVYCFCDVSENYHVDHIIPLSRGGTNWPDNLQILCKSCNCSKGFKTHDEFIEFLQKQKSV